MLDNLFNGYTPPAGAKAMGKTFIANVFLYMFAGLAVTGFTSYYVVNFAQDFMLSMFNLETGGFSMFGYLIMFAPLGIALLLQMGYRRFSIGVLMLLFGIYAVLLGTGLSTLALAYTSASLFKVFGITSLTFGAMAFLGYTTKTDLTKFGGIMYMLFIGLFIASMVNIFMQSDTMDWIISIVGIFVFTGLTAYKMQQLKYMSSDPELKGEERKKLELIGGFQLYILFINLFLSLLRLMGDRE